jgi:hypothetical protein
MKKIICLTLLLILNTSAFAETCVQEQVLREEFLFPEKNCTERKVVITNNRNILCKGNVFKIAFDCKFSSENVKAGDKISFSFLESIYTQEGTLIIPACTKVYATVINIEKPKIFNKNARVYLRYDCIELPNYTPANINAKTFTKDGSLKEGPWMTAGKVAASTIGLGAVGAGAGVGFAFIPNPAKIGTGLAIGIPVGASVGLLTGLVTPGLKYHAKAGEKIKIILCEELSLPILECK